MQLVLIALGAALLLVAPAYAQQVPAAKVPAAATATFAAQFAHATSVRWEKEGADYEAGFQQAGKDMAAVISPTGQLKETETGMSVAQLPAPVRATLARDYANARVGEAATIVRADGTTVYEAEISQRGKKRDVLFTADGKVTQ